MLFERRIVGNQRIFRCWRSRPYLALRVASPFLSRSYGCGIAGACKVNWGRKERRMPVRGRHVGILS
jgi:hypothetical protein